MTKERIKTHAVWLTLYAALFSAVAFADAPQIPGTDRTGLSPIVLDARAPAFDVQPVITRNDI